MNWYDFVWAVFVWLGRYGKLSMSQCKAVYAARFLRLLLQAV
jgi:hypothetical protein